MYEQEKEVPGGWGKPRRKNFSGGLYEKGKKIIIAGHTDEGVINAIEEFVASVVSKCENANNSDNNEKVFYMEEYNFVKRGEYNISSLFIYTINTLLFEMSFQLFKINFINSPVPL